MGILPDPTPEVQIAKHGTMRRYERYGCKCDLCRAVNARKTKQNRNIRRRRLLDLPAEYHGKDGTYVNWACRCVPCSAAHAEACAEQYEARKARRAS